MMKVIIEAVCRILKNSLKSKNFNHSCQYMKCTTRTGISTKITFFCLYVLFNKPSYIECRLLCFNYPIVIISSQSWDMSNVRNVLRLSLYTLVIKKKHWDFFVAKPPRTRQRRVDLMVKTPFFSLKGPSPWKGLEAHLCIE